MADDRRATRTASETGPSEIAPRRRAKDFGEVILLGLTTLLGVLWSIVLVTHFHGPLSGFGQSLWLMR
ncbi:hypothetical protein G3T14_16655 [Methylobacterium sp. BTF04]|uniref:hypothetical protein n=1 Tax=Methylobacterium sp. BTF04 TaxID=2708300 RepID=UPI0013D57E9D|nr:hypothetical protein [Methylobacterium sp. BTF04]NEU13750.1 hypothetical protein [Methylobacterium sp. BTF04]